jgi:hypothetical protein
MFENDRRWYQVERKRRRIILLVSWVIAGFVWHFSTREKGVGVAAALLLVYVQVETMWDHRREKWLWVSLTVIALVHLAAIWLIPYRLPLGPAITYVLPLVMIDGFLMWGLLRWLAYKLSPLHSSSAG